MADLQPPSEATLLFRRAKTADLGARDALFGLIYAELRARAAQIVGSPTASLDATVLVQEALLKLFEADVLSTLNDRNHLMALASRAMWQVLIDHRRRGGTTRHGGELRRLPVDLAIDRIESSGHNLVELREAMEQLERLEPRHAQVLNYRVLYQFSIAEIAHLLEISESTVDRDYRAARAWLQCYLEEE